MLRLLWLEGLQIAMYIHTYYDYGVSEVELLRANKKKSYQMKNIVVVHGMYEL